ncbi:DNA translocase FtsK [Viridibacillus arvi]|uniref:DNA translocase FtsK n=2 Tax=Viridibacillus arvi TaxID=263475 RepID=UPI003D27C0D0
MKWFKNVVARIMGDEIEEYDNEKKINNDRIEIQDTYEEYIEQEFETVQQEDSIPAFLRKRDAFRFPVISDSERSQMIQKETPSKQAPLQSNKKVKPKPQSVQPDQWQEQRQRQKQDRFQPTAQNPTTSQNRRSPFDNQVQQYQEPARFETREQRRPTTKNRYNEAPSKQERINPFNPKPNYDTTAPYRERPSSSLGRRSVENETETVTTTKPENVKKQKFKPTNVPSPVYGFQKPPVRSIHDQLEGNESNELKQTEDHLEVTKQATIEVMESQHITATEESTIVETKVEEAQFITETEINAAQSNVETEEEEAQAIAETEVEEVQAIAETEVEEAQVIIETIVMEQQPLEVANEEGLTESVIKIEEVQGSDCEEISSPGIVHYVEEPIQQQLIPVEIKEQDEVEERNLEVKLVGQAQTSIEEITIEEKPAIVEELIRRAEEPEDELSRTEEVILDASKKYTENIEQIKEPSSKEEEYQESIIKEESKLPFNVLMLKTDKEKWALKEAKTKQLLNMSVEETVLPLVAKEQPIGTIMTEKPEQEPILESYKVSDNQEVAATTVEPVIEPEIEESMPSRINENLEESLKYLESPEEKTEDFEWMDMQGEKLIEALSYFQVKGEIVQIVQGPAVTQFEITVGHGTKVSKIRNLADDLKLALAARDIRIQAPIPGKSSIGIEIPNQKSRPVRISEIVGDQLFIDSDSPLEAALGLDLTGKPVTLDLRKMPHGLIAGATGSGKSVCINSILVSLLLKASPQDVKLLLIDPKMVELAAFNHIPHLVSPVITDVKAATAALKWAVEEMERRYQLFAHVGARDITRYNAMVEEERKFSLKMPYLVIVIDELADLMMMAPTDVEEAICRIAQKARACGIHLVLATQRPSVDVITGLIKSNIPTRIAFSVSSQIDSRTILDSQGAERLLGRGDMLYLGNGMSGPIRVQGTFVTDEEIEAVTDYMRSLGEPEYIFEQEELLRKAEAIEEQDELFEEACRHICEQGTVSTSSLQRKFHIGYNRAARLVDMMEAQGFISESKGTKPRDVFLKTQDLENLFNNGYDEM